MHLAFQFYRESESSFDLLQRALRSLNPYAFVHFSPDVGTLLQYRAISFWGLDCFGGRDTAVLLVRPHPCHPIQLVANSARRTADCLRANNFLPAIMKIL
jgi:hypothetical protein